MRKEIPFQQTFEAFTEPERKSYNPLLTINPNPQFSSKLLKIIS